MLEKPGGNVLLKFNNLEDFIDFILNLKWLLSKKFFKIVFVGNNGSYLFQIKQLYAKVTYKLLSCKFIVCLLKI